MKKILTTGALLSIITPVAMTVSCGSKDTTRATFVRLHRDGMFADRYAYRMGSLKPGFKTFNFSNEYNSFNSIESEREDIDIDVSEIGNIKSKMHQYTFRVIWEGNARGRTTYDDAIQNAKEVKQWMSLYTVSFKHTTKAYSFFKMSDMSKLFATIKETLGEPPTTWAGTHGSLEENDIKTWVFTDIGLSGNTLPIVGESYGNYIVADASINNFYK